MMEVYRNFKFDAAHLLPNLPPDHKCSRLHGHTFEVCITVEGAVGEETGWVMDYAAIKTSFQPVLDQLDHAYLNDIPGLENPTSENIARWIWTCLKASIPDLSIIEVRETQFSGCRYRGEEEK